MDDESLFKNLLWVHLKDENKIIKFLCFLRTPPAGGYNNNIGISSIYFKL